MENLKDEIMANALARYMKFNDDYYIEWKIQTCLKTFEYQVNGKEKRRQKYFVHHKYDSILLKWLRSQIENTNSKYHDKAIVCLDFYRDECMESKIPFPFITLYL